MAEKTIMKLYPNGDLETIGVQLEQIPQQTSNLFIKATTTAGYLSSSGEIQPITSDGERVSDFIAVTQGDYTLRISWAHIVPTSISYYSVSYYNSDRAFMSRNYRFEQAGVANREETIAIPSGVAFVRISCSFVATVANVIFVKGTSVNASVSVFSFGENSIIVPAIAKYPTEQEKNYFIDNKSISGYITGSASSGYLVGDIKPTVEYERASDFINVDGWVNASVRVEFLDMDDTIDGYVAIALYGETKNHLSFPFRDATGVNSGNYVFQRQITIPTTAKFLRISSTYYDKSNATVKICVMRRSTTIPQHYDAFEDTYYWAVDTGNPISIFPEGIFIKGNLIQTNI